MFFDIRDDDYEICDSYWDSDKWFIKLRGQGERLWCLVLGIDTNKGLMLVKVSDYLLSNHEFDYKDHLLVSMDQLSNHI
jgi:hypothetical protein